MRAWDTSQQAVFRAVGPENLACQSVTDDHWLDWVFRENGPRVRRKRSTHPRKTIQHIVLTILLLILAFTACTPEKKSVDNANPEAPPVEAAPPTDDAPPSIPGYEFALPEENDEEMESIGNLLPQILKGMTFLSIDELS
jgi:hypothetical protein